MQNYAAIRIQACFRGYICRKKVVVDVRRDFFEIAKRLDKGVASELKVDATTYSDLKTLRLPSSLKKLPKIWRKRKVQVSRKVLPLSSPLSTPSNRSKNVSEVQSVIHFTKRLENGGNHKTVFISFFYHRTRTLTFLSRSLTVPSLENMAISDIERELLWAKKALEMRRLVLKHRDEN
jgi:hypothetical protein